MGTAIWSFTAPTEKVFITCPSIVVKQWNFHDVSNDNAGVLKWAQWERKFHVEQKDKSSLDFDFQYEYKLWKHGLSFL